MATQPKNKKTAMKAKGAATADVTRRRRSSEEIMERLITAAREEFKRCGFVGATTAVIARNAEVTEAQLFRYFDSKADLFREAVFEPLNKHFSEFNTRYASLPDDENIHERVRVYITELQEFLDEHSKLLLSLVVSQLFTSGSLQGVKGPGAKTPGGKTPGGKTQGAAAIDSLGHYFERGAATMSSRIDKNAQVDPALLVRVSFAGLLGCVLFKDWVFAEGMAADDAINAAIIAFMIHGISINDSALQESVTSGTVAAAKRSSTARKKPSGNNR